MSVEINEKMTLSCKNIVLEVENNSSVNPGKYVRLLNNICVDFESGMLNAIMGSSGGGKTTFINTIVGRINPSSKSSGTIELSNKTRYAYDWVKNVSYLEQDDYIVPNQTIKEFVLFATNCRRADRSHKENEKIVDDLLINLEISHRANVLLDSVSGGERKRAMLAVEFASESDIIILDEPTTGLDSHKAIEIISLVKNYAIEKNKIVIITIHQPGSGLFELIDKLFFISAGTKIYDGKASDVVQYFLDKGLVKPKTLSKSEFLFELFCNTSQRYPEIFEKKKIIDKILEDAKIDADQNSKNAVFNGASYPFINLRLELKQILEIFYRRVKLDFRSNTNLKKFIIFNILFACRFVYTALILKDYLKFVDCLKNTMITYVNAFSIANKKLGHTGNLIVEGEIVKSSHFLTIFYPFFNGSIFDNKEIISREINNSLYSISNLIIGNVLYSTFYATLTSIWIVVLLFCVGIDVYKMPITIISMLVGFIAGDLGKGLITIIAPTIALARVISIFYLLIMLLGFPFFAYNYLDHIKVCAIPKTYCFIFDALKYAIMISPTYFSNIYSVCYFFTKKKILMVSKKYSFIFGYRSGLLCPPYKPGDIHEEFNPIFYQFFSHVDSKYFVLAMFVLVVAFYIYAQFFFISYYYSPRLRMIL